MPAFLFAVPKARIKKSRHSNFTHTALTNNVYILSEDQQVKLTMALNRDSIS